jgi:hypothetical protein
MCLVQFDEGRENILAKEKCKCNKSLSLLSSSKEFM